MTTLAAVRIHGLASRGILAQTLLRVAHAAFLCLGLLFAACASAQGFDRAAELKRYRAWFTVFSEDMDRLAAASGAPM